MARITGLWEIFLSDELGEGYFAIGTDFYKTNCNLPKNDGKRITHTFYSYDPLAKAAKKAGYDMCWLDFSKVPENSQLKEQITDHVSMGSLGEGYSAFFMSIFPQQLPRITIAGKIVRWNDLCY